MPADEDPWLPPGTVHAIVPREPEEEAPAKPMAVQRVSIHASGGIDCGAFADACGDEPWTAPAAEDGLTLLAYDLTRLTPAGNELPQALRGHETPKGEAAPGAWWGLLAREIVESVGRDRWPAASTLLARDPWRDRLLVRHDARAHERVSAVLNAALRRQTGWIPVEVVRLDPKRGSARERLLLDVPWAGVRAHQGRSSAYLADYDIECGNSWSMSPLAGVLDTGLAVSARRVPGTAPAGDFELEIGWSDDEPRFDVFSTTTVSSYAPIEIEIPNLTAGHWRGRLPAQSSTHRIALDDGTVCIVTVGKERFLQDLPEPILGAPLGKQPQEDSATATGLYAHLESGPAHASIWGTAALAYEGRDGAQWLLSDWSNRELCGPALMDTSDADADSSFTVRVHDLTSQALMVDLSLRIAREMGAPRRRTAEHRRYGEETVKVEKVQVEFPTSRVVTIARRLVLPRFGVTKVPFEADLGNGIEAFTLTLKVTPDRN